MAIDNDNLADCFVHLPDQAGIPFALDYATIASEWREYIANPVVHGFGIERANRE